MVPDVPGYCLYCHTPTPPGQQLCVVCVVGTLPEPGTPWRGFVGALAQWSKQVPHDSAAGIARYRRAWKIREQQLGQNHPDTLATLRGLAILYGWQGQYQQAVRLHQQVLSAQEKQLGQNHPDLVSLLEEMATLLCEQGSYQESEAIYQRAVSLSERVYGRKHVATASILGNFAILYDRQRKWKEAEPLLREALLIYEQKLGGEQYATIMARFNLAMLYHHEGRYKEAEPLLQRALKDSRRRFGGQHPITMHIVGLYMTVIDARLRQEGKGSGGAIQISIDESGEVEAAWTDEDEHGDALSWG